MTAKIDYGELSDNELQLLIGLMMVAVNADDLHTTAETMALTTIGDDIGHDRFRAAAAQLKENYPTQKDILEAIPEIDRPEARVFIYGVVEQVIESDGVASQEEHLLQWLQKKWGLGL